MKYIKATELAFVPPSDVKLKRKTKLFQITAVEGGDVLGTVKWWPAWRRFAFFPAPGTLYESECLKDLSVFCATETAKRKLERAAERGE